MLFVVDVAKPATEIEEVEMVDSGHVARANAENGALGFLVGGFNSTFPSVRVILSNGSIWGKT